MSRRPCLPSRILPVIVIVGAAAANATSVVVAQSPSIAGRVVDNIGQPLPGVFVTAIPERGGLAARVTSGKGGEYQFETLPDGTYRVDFELSGFDLARRHHILVRAAERPAYADATLSISALCECLAFPQQKDLRERAGQVVDESKRPLPHARLQIVSPTRRQTAYADGEGRFRVRLPLQESWSLVASDSGFSAVTVQVSASGAGPVVITLPRARILNQPDSERFDRSCRCPDDLFTHDGR